MKTGGSAFPLLFNDDGSISIADRQGMTLRDYFAAKATDSDLSWTDEISIEGAKEIIGLPKSESWNVGVHWPMLRAKARFIHADAMIAEKGE